MIVELKLDVGDFLAFHKHYLKTYGKPKRRSLVIRIVLSIIWIAMNLPLMLEGRMNAVTLILFIFLLCLILFFPHLVRWMSLRRTKRLYFRPDNSIYLDPAVVTFTEEGFGVKKESGSSETKWSAVVNACETTEHFFLYVSHLMGYIIPKRFLRPGQAEELERLIAEFVPAGLNTTEITKNQ